MPNKIKYFYELTVSSSPHVHSPNRTWRLMLDVILALLPALVGAVFYFGPRVLALCGFSVAACVGLEWGYRKVMKLDATVKDLSAVVTGLLLAFVCPVTIPYWTLFIGDFLPLWSSSSSSAASAKLYEPGVGGKGLSVFLAGDHDDLGAAGQPGRLLWLPCRRGDCSHAPGRTASGSPAR